MKVVQLSGGVGGARLARGFGALDDVELTVIVNVGDDAEIHGLRVSPDIDTVCYSLAGIEGPMGWGRAKETFHLNEELAVYGIDNTFRLGDRDLALKLARTVALDGGESLSTFTDRVCSALAIDSKVRPVTDDKIRTTVELADGWTSFLDYFVARRHRDDIGAIRFEGADEANPAPGVLEAIREADLVIVGPSNPVLSIWPIMAVAGVKEALSDRDDIVAVSPLIGGKAVKGPAREVLIGLGFQPGIEGVLAAYQGLVSTIYVDVDDVIDIKGVTMVGTDIKIGSLEASIRLAREVLGL